jgi:hypothetical protein
MADNDTAHFDTWDYVVLVLMLLISASIGMYYRFTGGKQKTTQVTNINCQCMSEGLNPLLQSSYILLPFYV